MFCGGCGTALAAEARFCSACGAPAAPLVTYGEQRLVRPRTNRSIAGVCAGLAKHYGWNLTWVRVLTVLITGFSSGAGLAAYVIF